MLKGIFTIYTEGVLFGMRDLVTTDFNYIELARNFENNIQAGDISAEFEVELKKRCEIAMDAFHDIYKFATSVEFLHKFPENKTGFPHRKLESLRLWDYSDLNKILLEDLEDSVKLEYLEFPMLVKISKPEDIITIFSPSNPWKLSPFTLVDLHRCLEGKGIYLKRSECP